MKTYEIKGNITYNQSDESKDGFATVEISEMYVDADSCEEALEKFLEDHEEFDFFGSLKEYDAETRGHEWARYRDQNEDQTIMVEVVEN